MRNDTAHDNTVANTMYSRGKYTFLSRLALPTNEPVDAEIEVARKFHGNNAQVRYMVKLFMLLGLPLGAPTPMMRVNTTA